MTETEPGPVAWLRLAPAVVAIALVAAGFAIAFRTGLTEMYRLLGG